MRVDDRQSVVRMSVLFALLLLLGPALAASAADVSLSVITSTGVLYGGAQEIVWDNGYRVSELDWPLQPLYWAGTGLSMEASYGLRVGLEVRSAAPLRSGFITDSDYLNGDGIVTHFSRHDAYAERAIFVDGTVGWEFSFLKYLSLTPFAGVNVMLLKLSARDGYLQYPPEAAAPFTPWTPGTPRILVFGTGIIYEQDTVAPTVGLKLSATAFGRFRGTLSWAVSPLVYCSAVDNHLLRQVDFYSTLSKGLLIEPSLQIEYQATQSAILSLTVSYRSITGLLGDTTEVFTGPSAPAWTSFFGAQPGSSAGPFSNTSGASFAALNAAFALRVAL